MGDIEFVLPDHERQIRSAQKRVQSIRHAISRTRQTHALLRVSHSSHCAAVHLSISPFNIQQHQEQIFFSSSYDYSLCCTHSESVITPPLIADNVQIIYDTYYQPGQWDFSPKHPEVICHSIGRSCEQAIETRLDELRRSILPNSQQTSSSSASDLVASTTTQNLNEAGSVNSLDVRQGKRHRRNTSKNEAGHKRARGSGKNKAGFADQDGQDDMVVTDKIIKKIRKGLKDLKVKDGVYFPPVPNTNESQKILDLPDGVNNHLSAQISISVAWERALWEQTVAAKVDSNQYIWYLRLLASYFFLLRTSIIERDNISWQDTVSISASSVRNRVMWRKAASMVNSIILGLSSSSGWGSKAYLVIQALAATKSGIIRSGNLSQERRSLLVTNIVKELRKDNPPASTKLTIWRPTALIGTAIKMDEQSACQMLGLPYVTNDNSAAAGGVLGMPLQQPPALTLPVATTSLASIVDPTVHMDCSATTSKEATPAQAQSRHSEAVTEKSSRHPDLPRDTQDPFGEDWSMLENDPTLYTAAFGEDWDT